MARPVGVPVSKPSVWLIRATPRAASSSSVAYKSATLRVRRDSAHTATTAILPASTSASIWRMAGRWPISLPLMPSSAYSCVA